MALTPSKLYVPKYQILHDYFNCDIPLFIVNQNRDNGTYSITHITSITRDGSNAKVEGINTLTNENITIRNPDTTYVFNDKELAVTDLYQRLSPKETMFRNVVSFFDAVKEHYPEICI